MVTLIRTSTSSFHFVQMISLTLRTSYSFNRYISLMSQVAPPIFNCNTCQRLLVVKICKSDKNGNAGRAFTNCYKKHANNTRCDFFSWVDPTLSPPSSPFPSSSPASESSLTLQVSAPPSAQPTAGPSAHQNLVNAPPRTTEPTCSKPGKVRCNSTRLHATCTRQMCRRHCIEAGGCQGTKTHMAQNTATLAGKQRAAVSPFNIPLPSSLPPPSTATASTSTAMDLFADPRYASQMTAAFTQQYADKQAMEERQRAVDAERLANIEKAKNHVIIYAWPKVFHLLWPTSGSNTVLTCFLIGGC